MKYMGIDHHKQYSHMTIVDKEGKELRSGNVRNTYHDIEAFLDGRGEEIKAVIEAGRSSYVMVDLMKEFGVDIRIAHPAQVKAIAKAKIKTDKRDSRILAHLLRMDFIPEAIPRANSMFMMLLPITLPTDMPYFFFIVAVIVVASSGSEVPTATMVKPIKSAEM
mgnify:CR=1 FL=1